MTRPATRTIGAIVILFVFAAQTPRILAAESRAMEMADAMSLSTDRKAGQSLTGQKMEMGPGTWRVDGSLVFGPDGVTSARVMGGTAFHEIPPAVGVHRIAAEINPASLESCAGLAFFRANPAGNFFGTTELSFLFTRNGSYEIGFKGLGTIKAGSHTDYVGFQDNGFNKLELAFDALGNTLSARINGSSILEHFPLKGQSSSLFHYAGFRLNGPLTPGGPGLRNYSVSVTPMVSAGIVPVDLAETFFEPRSDVSLRFKVASVVPGQAVPFSVSDYQGKDVLKGDAAVDAAGELVLPVNVPRGFYELAFPASRESFGLVSLERAEKSDPFFCMDSSLSWLELDPQRRRALVDILARCGIAMSRERLGLGAVNPAPGKFNWEGGSHAFDTLRKTYADAKVPILELLDGRAKHHGVIPESPYPQNLPELAASWVDVAGRWEGDWGGAEVCNEPDLKNLPADQYVLNAKTMSYALSEAKVQAPLVSGVFARMPPGPFFDTCLANGMLTDSDAVSFHSYDRAPDIQAMVTRYRAWLKQGGAEAMPLWHTECGFSWTNGPARPPRAEDAASALEIAAKAMESRACGVARHFPFVYVYYEEGLKNFGMMGREATGLRSMAAYAMCAKALGERPYLGDLTGLAPDVKLARVFGRRAEGECVAVLYTGKVDSSATLSMSSKFQRISGIDGRELRAVEGRIPIPDGIAYVWINSADLGAALKVDTEAANLYQLGQHALSETRLASPVILQFLAPQTPSRVSARQYLVTEETAKALPVNVRVHNLGKTPAEVAVQLQFSGTPPEKTQRVLVAPMGFRDVMWALDATQHLDIATMRFITVRATVTAEIAPSPLAIPMMMSGKLEEHLKRHSRQRPLPITDLNRWSGNQASHGKSRFSVVESDVWRMDVTFTGTHGNWAYPKISLPEKLDPAIESGFLIRARVLKPASNVAILGIPSQPGGVGFWCNDLFPSDGQWHVVYVPFDEFSPGPNQTGNQNARLDPATWGSLEIGMGSQVAENALEVSHLLVVGGTGKDGGSNP